MQKHEELFESLKPQIAPKIEEVLGAHARALAEAHIAAMFEGKEDDEDKDEDDEDDKKDGEDDEDKDDEKDGEDDED